MIISVVVPVFNVEEYLGDCIDSILLQTVKDFEIVLVDDGSTDKSGIICDEYASLYNNIKVVHQKNQGQAAARNRGVSLANGEYIFFIDSDDVISVNTAFEQLISKMTDRPDIIAFRYNKWFSERISDMNVSFAGISESDKYETIKELVSKDAFFCSCWSKTVRRDILIDNNICFDESSWCEDMDWYFNVVKYSKTIKLVDKPLINYRQREGSVTKQSGEKGFQDNIAVIDKWKKEFEDETDGQWRDEMLAALAKLYCNLLISFSSGYNNLKKYSNQVYDKRSLLQYDLNPRTKLFKKVTNIIGIKMLCQLLRIASVMR